MQAHAVAPAGANNQLSPQGASSTARLHTLLIPGLLKPSTQGQGLPQHARASQGGRVQEDYSHHNRQWGVVGKSSRK